MQWCASIYGKGYMPPGEAVSNVTWQPLLSSMSEPLTVSAFILAALLYQGQCHVSLIPPLYNAAMALRSRSSRIDSAACAGVHDSGALNDSLRNSL